MENCDEFDNRLEICQISPLKLTIITVVNAKVLLVKVLSYMVIHFKYIVVLNSRVGWYHKNGDSTVRF